EIRGPSAESEGENMALCRQDLRDKPLCDPPYWQEVHDAAHRSTVQAQCAQDARSLRSAGRDAVQLYQAPTNASCSAGATSVREQLRRQRERSSQAPFVSQPKLLQDSKCVPIPRGSIYEVMTQHCPKLTIWV